MHALPYCDEEQHPLPDHGFLGRQSTRRLHCIFDRNPKGKNDLCFVMREEGQD